MLFTQFRYSDFMVHELALNGSVVKLSSLSLPDDSDNSQVCMHSSNLHISLISIFFALISGYKGQFGDSVLC